MNPRPISWLLLGAVFLAGTLAVAQEGSSGRVLLEGLVRPGLPVPLHVGTGAAWQGEWGQARVQVTGNAVAFLWPRHRSPLLTGPGAPPPGAFYPLPPGTTLVGVLPRAADLLGARGEHEKTKNRLQKTLNRPVRFVGLEPDLEDLPPPVVSGLDLVVAASPSELRKYRSIWTWVRLGGSALVLEPGKAGAPGLGRIVCPGPATAWEALDLPGAFAEIRPPMPGLPEVLPDPSRSLPALVVILYLGAVVVWAGRIRRVGRGVQALGGIAVLVFGSGILFLAPGDLWTRKASRALWWVPGPGLKAWVHTCWQVEPRGGCRAEVLEPEAGLVFTHVPPGAEVKAGTGAVQVRWKGKGWLAHLSTRGLGEGFRLRRAGGRTHVLARLPSGVEMRPAYWIRPGEVRGLGRLRSGEPRSVEDAERVSPEELPAVLRVLLAGLPTLGDSAVLLGRLRGESLRGENFGLVILE